MWVCFLDKGSGSQSILLVKLGVITGWRGKRIFHENHSPIRRLQFAPSELISECVSNNKLLPQITKNKRERGRKVLKKRMELLCHSGRVRYYQKIKTFRENSLFPKSEKGMSANASVIVCGGESGP